MNDNTFKKTSETNMECQLIGNRVFVSDVTGKLYKCHLISRSCDVPVEAKDDAIEYIKLCILYNQSLPEGHHFTSYVGILIEQGVDSYTYDIYLYKDKLRTCGDRKTLSQENKEKLESFLISNPSVKFADDPLADIHRQQVN